MTAKCCEIVYWKHDEGWDAYRKEDCYKINEQWIPTWFDTAIVDSVATKTNAQKEIKELHPLGICLVGE